MKTNLEKMIMMLLAAVAFTACVDSDVFDPSLVEKEHKATFEENFLNKYAFANLNNNWDYSHKQTAYSLPSNDSNAKITRADVNYSITKGSEYEVDLETVAWMRDVLTEGEDNRALGQPFYMTVPNNEFTIVPIFQGQAGAVYSLHVVVDGVDIKVWEKSEGLSIKTGTNKNWKTLAIGDNTLEATAVKAVPYTFKNLPVGKEMYMYLSIDEGTDGYNKTGTQQSSLNGMMIALSDIKRPKNIEAENEVMIIACEDANLDKSDWDMNDAVFLVYGKPVVPQPVVIKEGDPVVHKKTVRYMVEDLGAMDDFDFNDIVVDVSDISIMTPIYTNGVLTGWVEDNHYQEATLRHLGGTLPFILNIGDTYQEERPGEMGVTPNETFRVSGWDMDKHNVTIRVQQKGNDGVFNTIPFPKAGEIPMIIAVDPTQEWMNERVSVPEAWFNIPE